MGNFPTDVPHAATYVALWANYDILVSMTRAAKLNVWALQDAKARFSEVVRLAKLDGPQRVTVHGRDEVVIVAAGDFDKLTGSRTGQDLIDAFRSAPFDLDLDLNSERSPVRGVKL